MSKEKVVIYLKSTCITCRRALGRLRKHRVEVEEVDIFKRKLTKSEIRNLLKFADVSPRDALRRKDKMYKELKLDEIGYDDERILSFMEKNPGLILRPIVVRGEKATIATKPDLVNKIL